MSKLVFRSTRLLEISTKGELEAQKVLFAALRVELKDAVIYSRYGRDKFFFAPEKSHQAYLVSNMDRTSYELPTLGALDPDFLSTSTSIDGLTSLIAIIISN
jgi:hypothetical protein